MSNECVVTVQTGLLAVIVLSDVTVKKGAVDADPLYQLDWQPIQ